MEAAAHAYASLEGAYAPLTKYWVEEEAGARFFCGEIKIPISVGTKGGALSSNLLYIQNLKILGEPNARQLAEIITSVGLAQNFAALRALSVEGIQKGHMKLHAKNLAVSAGVRLEDVEKAVKFMENEGEITKEKAIEFVLINNRVN